MKQLLSSLLVFLGTAGVTHAQQADHAPPYDPDKARAAARIADPEAATQAYLDSIPAERRARTKAYAAGNYWLEVIGFLYTATILALLLASGLSARMRDVAGQLVRWRWLQTMIYALMFVLVVWLAELPLTIYGSFVHETRYGLLHQSFGAWLGDQGKGLLILLVIGPLLILSLYAVLRRKPRTWWVWSWAVVMAFAVVGVAVAPVYLTPLFNQFTPLPESDLRTQILEEAQERGVPAHDVFEMDESKRSDKIGAYVAGLFGSTRIVLLDTLLKRCDADQVLFVTGHEMGHYVLNHIWKSVLVLGALNLAGFLFVRWAFGRLAAGWPGAGITGVADPAGLPLLMLLFLVFSFVLTPVINTGVRMHEAQADAFGLDVSRRPDAAATSFLMLGEYRELDPSPVVEFIFFDHPSGRNRIRRAMEWKQAHRTQSLGVGDRSR